ncbi:hypothetical protein LCGC14_2067340 [marine sediment metagenome]|uniref:Uncharacterized protein n=1 Tax=marine sediment metagenome TaxID=412755 RepID=A0A0F9EJC7_9ZZZZ
MKDFEEHLILEATLQAALIDITRVLEGMTLLSIEGRLPEEITREFVDSVVGAMKKAQGSVCEGCSANEGCHTREKFLTVYDSLKYDVWKSVVEEKLKAILEKKQTSPLDFSRKFLEN